MSDASMSRRCWPRWLLLTIVLSCGGQIASADPLVLRLGDIRKFMSPEELSASLDDAKALWVDAGGYPGPSLE